MCLGKAVQGSTLYMDPKGPFAATGERTKRQNAESSVGVGLAGAKNTAWREHDTFALYKSASIIDYLHLAYRASQVCSEVINSTPIFAVLLMGPPYPNHHTKIDLSEFRVRQQYAIAHVR